MDRVGLLDRIAVELDAMLDAAGILVTDDPAGLGTALDTVEEVLDRNPTVPTHLTYDLFAYYVLDRIVMSLGAMFDVSLEQGFSFRLSQLYTHAKELRTSKRGIVGWILDMDSPAEQDTFGNTMTVVTPFLGPEGGA